MALPFEYLGAGLLKMRAKSTLGKVSMWHTLGLMMGWVGGDRISMLR